MTSTAPSASGRRSPTPDELRVWRDYIETAQALGARMASRMQDESELSPADYSVLLSLSEAPDRRRRSSELASAMGWERSRLSHHLGRMERRALIRREECATDSRGSEIVLTDEGAHSFRRASAPHLHAVRELFLDALTADQLAALGAATASLRASLDPAASTPEPA